MDEIVPPERPMHSTGCRGAARFEHTELELDRPVFFWKNCNFAPWLARAVSNRIATFPDRNPIVSS
jgi:hypothetical protein